MIVKTAAYRRRSSDNSYKRGGKNGIEMLSAAVYPRLIRISVKPELIIPAMKILHETFLEN